MMPGGTIQLLLLLLFLVPAILFLITQQNTLRAVAKQNRKLEPGMVWLQLIPLFGMVYQFIVVSRISQSLQREFNSWGSDDSILGYADSESVEIGNSEPTYALGIAYCTLFCCSIIPFLGPFASLAGLVCWIIYWVKLAEYKAKVTRRRVMGL
jgi:hypothetical protein